MNRTARIVFLLLLCSTGFVFQLQGQSRDTRSVRHALELVKAEYGLDPVLVNGKYFEDIYRNDLGHPYLGRDEFQSGYLIIRDERTDTFRLKFNIYNQTLVVSTSGDKTAMTFIPPNEFITGFSIQEETFRRYIFEGGQQGFYHDICSGETLSCIYGWSKKAYDSYHNKTFKALKFTDQRKKYYLVLDNKPLVFGSNRSFVKHFPDEHQKVIRHFMKENSIKLKKDPDALEELCAFCDELVLKNKQQNPE